MNTHTKIDEKKVFEKDVKTMSYDDLMAAIRYLDQEREILARDIHKKANEQNNRSSQPIKNHRAA